MTRPRSTGLKGELERRLSILSHPEETERRLPLADTVALASVTIGSFAVVLIAQVL